MPQLLGKASSSASGCLMHQRLRHAGAASILRRLRSAASARMRSRPRLSCPRTPLALVDGPLAALTRTRLVSSLYLFKRISSFFCHILEACLQNWTFCVL